MECQADNCRLCNDCDRSVNKCVRRRLLGPALLHLKCQNNKNLLSTFLGWEVSIQQAGEISTTSNKMFCLLSTFTCEYCILLGCVASLYFQDF